MSEDELFEQIKASFVKCENDKIIEFASALIVKLMTNGVKCSCNFEPAFVEGISENGLYTTRHYAEYDKGPIRDTLKIDFTDHDEKVRKELRREFLKSIPPIDRSKPWENLLNS